MSSPSVKRKLYRVCLTGMQNVGKTSIFNAIRGKPFSGDKVFAKAETNFYNVTKTVPDPADPSESVEIDLQIWDTAGMERYESLTDSYYRNASAVIMVFSKGTTKSFSCINSIMADIQRIDSCPDSLFFLVGNKDDLQEDDVQVNDARVYDFINGKRWAFQKFMKTSAKNHTGIYELIAEVANSLVINRVKPVRRRSDALKVLYSEQPSSWYSGYCCY